MKYKLLLLIAGVGSLAFHQQIKESLFQKPAEPQQAVVDNPRQASVAVAAPAASATASAPARFFEEKGYSNPLDNSGGSDTNSSAAATPPYPYKSLSQARKYITSFANSSQ